MSARAYTVSEVDELREVISEREKWGSSFNNGFRVYFVGSSPSKSPVEILANTQKVEEQVRTAMCAGLTAKDFIEEDRRRAEQETP